MPIPKNKQDLYGKVIDANLNRGVSKKTAKKRAEAAVMSKKKKEMKSRPIIPGEVFSKLTIIERLIDRTDRVIVKVKCVCGTIKTARWVDVYDGSSKSCGCSRFDEISPCPYRKFKREWKIWYGMHERCFNEEHPKFPEWGGRGIRVDQRWESFQNFVEDMGKAPPKYSLDRIDNNKSYGPDNCRWTSVLEQNCNKRNNIIITINGVTKTAGHWADHFGICRTKVYSQLKKGKTLEEIISCTTLVSTQADPAEPLQP